MYLNAVGEFLVLHIECKTIGYIYQGTYNFKCFIKEKVCFFLFKIKLLEKSLAINVYKVSK